MYVFNKLIDINLDLRTLKFYLMYTAVTLGLIYRFLLNDFFIHQAHGYEPLILGHCNFPSQCLQAFSDESRPGGGATQV